MFLTLPKFELSCFNWPKLDLGCCNLPNLCKSEWNSSNLPRRFHLCPSLNETQFEWNYFNYQIWLRLLEFAQMFLIVCKFEWSGYILPKLEWSCLKFPKIEWRCSTWPKFEWSYCHLVRVDLVGWNLPKFFQIIEAFLTSLKFEWSCLN